MLAYREVSFVKSALRSTRETADAFHSRVYSKAMQIASMVNVQESVPRTTGRQCHRNNVPAACPSQYYKRQVTIPILDHLISELESRFNTQTSSIVSQVMLLLPSEVVELDSVITSSEITDLVALYEDILPSPASLDTELHCWCIRWRSPENATAAVELNTPLKLLPSIDADFFPNIKQLMKIACTQSVTSVECERSISSLRFLKTYLRSSMREGRLNGLALLFIHRDIACDVEAVVDEFARRNPRRLQLCNPLCADRDD